LQALDATLAGASLREVAEGLFGADAVADWYSDGGLRSKVRRLVRRGDALMRGGYRRLAQLPPLEKGRFDGTQNVPEQKPRFLRLPPSGCAVWPGFQPMEVHTMRPAPLRPAAAVSTAAAQPQRYLTNDEAADYLRLSPRTLEKQRVIGGGPRFASSAAASCTPWPTSMPGPPTAASRRLPIPNTPSTTRPTAVRADRRRAGGHRHVQPALPSRQRPLQEREQLDLFRALPGDMAPRDSQDLMAYPFFSLASRGSRPSTSARATSRSAWKARRSTASPRSGMRTC
jgi:hypothetical protein